MWFLARPEWMAPILGALAGAVAAMVVTIGRESWREGRRKRMLAAAVVLEMRHAERTLGEVALPAMEKGAVPHSSWTGGSLYEHIRSELPAFHDKAYAAITNAYNSLFHLNWLSEHILQLEKGPAKPEPLMREIREAYTRALTDTHQAVREALTELKRHAPTAAYELPLPRDWEATESITKLLEAGDRPAFSRGRAISNGSKSD